MHLHCFIVCVICFTNFMSTVCQRVKHDFFLFVLFPYQKENMCSSWKSLIWFSQGRLNKLCALLMWQSYHVHCYHTLYDAADIVITSVTFIQSQLLDVGWHPKDDSWSRGAKKKEQHGQPSHDGRYAVHAVQISLATNLGLFEIITIDLTTNIYHIWFSGLQENGFQAIGFNSKYPSIKKSMCSMNSQYFAQKNIFIILRCSWFSPSCFLRQLCSCWKTSACTW